MLDTTRQTNVRPRSTAANVYEMLRNEIVLGTLKPEQPIREAEIAAGLNVSRTPVREALLRLSSLGLVDIFPQSGTLVAPIRLEKVRATQLIREVVEVEVCRRACRLASQEDFDTLLSIVEEQEFAAIRKDMRRSFELDETFHRRIFEAANCLAVYEELEDVKTHLNRVRFVAVNWPNRPGTIIVEHRDILDALIARDEQAVTEAMTAHLRAILYVLDDFSPRPQ